MYLKEQIYIFAILKMGHPHLELQFLSILGKDDLELERVERRATKYRDNSSYKEQIQRLHLFTPEKMPLGCI